MQRVDVTAGLFPKGENKTNNAEANSAQVSGVIQLRSATRCRSHELITDQDPAPATG